MSASENQTKILAEVNEYTEITLPEDKDIKLLFECDREIQRLDLDYIFEPINNLQAAVGAPAITEGEESSEASGLYAEIARIDALVEEMDDNIGLPSGTDTPAEGLYLAIENLNEAIEDLENKTSLEGKKIHFIYSSDDAAVNNIFDRRERQCNFTLFLEDFDLEIENSLKNMHKYQFNIQLSFKYNPKNNEDIDELNYSAIIDLNSVYNSINKKVAINLPIAYTTFTIQFTITSNIVNFKVADILQSENITDDNLQLTNGVLEIIKMESIIEE